jgi:hypothetical protein
VREIDMIYQKLFGIVAILCGVLLSIETYLSIAQAQAWALLGYNSGWLLSACMGVSALIMLGSGIYIVTCVYSDEKGD